MIGKQTAIDIALLYQEIENAEKLLADVDAHLERNPIAAIAAMGE